MVATVKPNLTRTWAAGAPGANVVDPDTTTPGKFDVGWLAEVPPFEHFNFLQKLFTQGLAHASEQGIMSWDMITTYPIDGLAKGSDGEVYVAILEQSGNDPVGDNGTNWGSSEIKTAPRTYDFIASMKLDRSLRVGQIVSVLDYASGRNSGIMFGSVVGAATGTDDGGSFIDLDNGFQWKQNFNPLGIPAKHFNLAGDDSTNDGAALNNIDAYTLSIGGSEIHIGSSISIISSVFTLSVGNSLIGNSRSNSVIKQINTSANGIKVSGGCTLRNIRIEAPIAGVDTTTIGLDSSGSADVIVEQVRVLYFGRCVESTGLTWRQSYTHVRCEQPRLFGFNFNEPNVHLEIYLNQCYVVNTSILGSSVKESYHIEGSLGTYMTLCTSDGGFTAGESTLGMNIINSHVVCDMSHWEGYKIRTGHVVGAEYDSIIRVSGSTLVMNGVRFHNCEATVPADDVLIYCENGSSVVLKGVTPNTNTFNSFSSQHFGISDDFGDNLMTIEGGNRLLVLGAQRGTGAGEAQYTRKGLIKKETISGASTVIDVNTVDTLILTGTTGDVSNFTPGHSSGHKVEVIWREAGSIMTDSASFRLAGGGNFTPQINSMQTFKWSNEASLWQETFQQF